MEISGKSVAVIGLGASGQSAMKLLAGKGARVTGLDDREDEEMKRIRTRLKDKGMEVVLGGKTLPPGIRFDLAVLSPGVNPTHAFVKELKAGRIEIIGELEAGYLFCHCPLVALTGTNGKTTTTELINRVLKAGGKKTLAVGNIGVPLTEICLDSAEYDLLVVEVSSFQLETIRTFRPHTSLMMNITPDHFDRYPGLEPYARAKARLWENQGPEDWAVVNVATEHYLGSLGLQPRSQVIRYSIGPADNALFHCRNSKIFGPDRKPCFDMRESNLRGTHNAENVMAAIAVAGIHGVDLEKALQAIRSYRPQAHRLETVQVVAGVEYVNDSKATNIDALEKALTAFDRPIVLIAGGKDKGFDYSTVIPRLKRSVKACYLIGDMAKKMKKLWGAEVDCVVAGTLENAVSQAARKAVPGDVVLLSPGCSSFDQFQNYEDRGNAFREAVRSIK